MVFFEIVENLRANNRRVMQRAIVGAVVAIAAALAVWSVPAHALSQTQKTNACLAATLTSQQIRMLDMALDIGGFKLAAIIYQESSFCANKVNPGHKSIGCGQLHMSAVHSVSGIHWRVATIAHDNAVNLTLSENFLRRCQREFGWPDALACYYYGQPAASRMTHAERVNDPYTKAVLAKLAALRALPIGKN